MPSTAIHETMEGFNSKHIRFIDSYYRPHSPVVQEILKEISQYHITIFTGITLLKDKAYVEFVNQYVDCLLIGLESTSDFTLKHVAKGYRYKDIELAVENMIQYLDRRIFLEISVILGSSLSGCGRRQGKLSAHCGPERPVGRGGLSRCGAYEYFERVPQSGTSLYGRCHA